MRRVTLCSAVRTGREARRTTANRRLEKQRRGEVPPLVNGYVDVTCNYYTAYNSSSSVIRRLSSGILKHHLKAKRPRASELRSVSEIDIVNDIHDSEGFSDIVNSDDEASPPDDLPESMLKQVEAYLNLRLTSELICPITSIGMSLTRLSNTLNFAFWTSITKTWSPSTSNSAVDIYDPWIHMAI